MSISSKDFEIILTLAEYKNITHAAEKLYITQPALSKRINYIENEIATQLVIRTKKGVYFTPSGEEVIKSARKIIFEIENLKENLKTKKGTVCGTLNIGISMNYSYFRLPSLLSIFRNEFPDVDINMTVEHSRNLYKLLNTRKIDVAILRGDFDWKQNKFLLAQENICAIKSQQYKKDSFNNIPLIQRKSDTAFESQVFEWMLENDIKIPNSKLIVDNLITTVEMVERDLGWAVVPRICLDNFSGIITPLYFKDQTPIIRSTYLMFSDNAQKLPQVNAFIKTVREFHNI